MKKSSLLTHSKVHKYSFKIQLINFFSYSSLLLYFTNSKSLIELCTRNYATLNGLVNGVDGIFKDYTKTLSKSLI